MKMEVPFQRGDDIRVLRPPGRLFVAVDEGTAPKDETAQCRICRIDRHRFHAEEYFRGLYWWKWDEQNPRTQFCDAPAGDKGFILDGKPAAEVLKQCFRRPGNTARRRE